MIRTWNGLIHVFRVITGVLLPAYGFIDTASCSKTADNAEHDKRTLKRLMQTTKVLTSLWCCCLITVFIYNSRVVSN